MRNIIIFIIALFYNINIIAEIKDYEIQGPVTRVGGNGKNIIFVQAPNKFIKIVCPNLELYKSCEEYLLLQMQFKYKSMRLVNFASFKEHRLLEFTLGEDSFCLLDGSVIN